MRVAAPFGRRVSRGICLKLCKNLKPPRRKAAARWGRRVLFLNAELEESAPSSALSTERQGAGNSARICFTLHKKLEGVENCSGFQQNSRMQKQQPPGRGGGVGRPAPWAVRGRRLALNLNGLGGPASRLTVTQLAEVRVLLGVYRDPELVRVTLTAPGLPIELPRATGLRLGTRRRSSTRELRQSVKVVCIPL